MKLSYSGISREMITEAIVGRKVFLTEKYSSRTAEEGPNFGIVVSGNFHASTLWVLWRPMDRPDNVHIDRLYLLKEERNIGKGMKWHGKTLGELEKFVEQARVEGADEDTTLNPNTEHHVHIEVLLPLTTDAKGRSYPTAAELVDGAS